MCAIRDEGEDAREGGGGGRAQRKIRGCLEPAGEKERNRAKKTAQGLKEVCMAV